MQFASHYRGLHEGNPKLAAYPLTGYYCVSCLIRSRIYDCAWLPGHAWFSHKRRDLSTDERRQLCSAKCIHSFSFIWVFLLNVFCYILRTCRTLNGWTWTGLRFSHSSADRCVCSCTKDSRNQWKSRRRPDSWLSFWSAAFFSCLFHHPKNWKLNDDYSFFSKLKTACHLKCKCSTRFVHARRVKGINPFPVVWLRPAVPCIGVPDLSADSGHLAANLFGQTISAPGRRSVSSPFRKND